MHVPDLWKLHEVHPIVSQRTQYSDGWVACAPICKNATNGRDLQGSVPTKEISNVVVATESSPNYTFCESQDVQMALYGVS